MNTWSRGTWSETFFGTVRAPFHLPILSHRTELFVLTMLNEPEWEKWKECCMYRSSSKTDGGVLKVTDVLILVLKLNSTRNMSEPAHS